MISLLIWLCLLIVVLYLVNYVLGMLDLPKQVKTAITILIGIIVLLSILQKFGMLNGVVL